MDSLVSCIQALQSKLDKHRKDDLKEYPTRTIFIDPLLQALGWDVRDPEDVELEFPTIDGKSVDYAPKINRKPVLFIEAKSLNDPLTDVKSITQVVGYAANAGVEWCILTNGIRYKVYHSTEKAEAPDKLLYEVSLDQRDATGIPIQQIGEQFLRFSRDSMAKGVLDDIGEQVFTTGKIRKALDRLFIDPPNTLVRLIRSTVQDDSISPAQIKVALKRLWSQASPVEITPGHKIRTPDAVSVIEKGKERPESHHIQDKPQEVVELFRSIDKFCRELDPINVRRNYLAKYIKYSHDKHIFCCINISNSGLRVWLKLKYSELNNPPAYVRDVSRVGHWGSGDVELVIDKSEKLQSAKIFIQKSFDKNKST
jgi:predicted transport protein